MARFIAFYLPQYHPIKENDIWYGKGFTEWTNVTRARPLFRGHYQPHYPADLGYYDLRVPEVREEQADLAREAGIEGFMYWHYWFGDGRQLLERPLNEVIRTGKPDFPFCVGWANHSWYKKNWDPKSKGKNILLMEQSYPGKEDYINHFNSLLPAFQDKRYIKVNGKLLFIIYDALNFPDLELFIELWNKLAKDNGLEGFYFVSKDFDCRNMETILNRGIDAIYNSDATNIHHKLPLIKKCFYAFERIILKRPTVFEYSDAIKYMFDDRASQKQVIPTIFPNWDHSPRSGSNAFILNHSTPKLFGRVAREAKKIVSSKPDSEQIVFIASWNEWGEGNHMEPDQKFGKGYIEALHDVVFSQEY